MSAIPPWPFLALSPAAPRALTEYWIDSWQRGVLTLDVLRQRGNQMVEHAEAGKPPLLKFGYEVVIDGRELERPCCYQLLRIRPPAGTETNPTARPFIVFDPRAGHGPGIGGFKEASQVGVAMRAGSPVYFVSFLPDPVPGQTIEDIARAEVRFVEKVIELHPEAQSAPAIVGNCQGGWALMLMASIAPELAGVISVAGSPLSYWAGVRGTNPMRYLGGLAGGAWMASLLGDLGNGIFDGAALVANFENANPSNTYWSKTYNLYSQVDTEEPRFLDFERWWSGFFFLTSEEMRFIVDELFVGNKLSRGRIVLSDRTRVDLRKIRAPIVVIASFGDNITPPQQALNWIPDLYDNVDQIRAAEQTIVYTLHPSIGHLGIFVSAKVALKEHAEFVGALDMIETLPPGLYEMIIEEEHEEDSGTSLAHDEYLVRFEPREIADILVHDDGRDDEEAFETVARLSEVNQGLYDTFIGPWVKMWSNEGTAEALKLANPMRLERMLQSDLNPWMAGLRTMAELTRAHRREADPDNPFRQLEQGVSEQIVASLDRYRDLRDLASEALFWSVWTSPLVEALAGLRAPHADERKPAARREDDFRAWVELKLAALRAEEREGDFAEAVLRIMYGALRYGGIAADARGFRIARKIAKKHPRFAHLSRTEWKAKARRAAFLVSFDPEGALESLPALLPQMDDRREALEVVRRIGSWRPELTPDLAKVIGRVEQVLGLARPTAVEHGSSSAA